MSPNKKVAVISASPKINEKAASEWMAMRAEALMAGDGVDIRHINVRKSEKSGQTAEDFAYMAQADAMLIIFPLYIFCTPGLLTRFLQDYYDFVCVRQAGVTKAAVYTVVNCGFPEPEINGEAVRVIKSFSEKVGAEFRFGVLIGSGGMILGAQNAPFMKKAMARLDGAIAVMKDEVLTGRREAVENINIRINFPRKLYFFGGDRGWVATAKKNGLKKEDLYAKPYATRHPNTI